MKIQNSSRFKFVKSFQRYVLQGNGQTHREKLFQNSNLLKSKCTKIYRNTDYQCTKSDIVVYLIHMYPLHILFGWPGLMLAQLSAGTCGAWNQAGCCALAVSCVPPSSFGHKLLYACLVIGQSLWKSATDICNMITISI